MRYSTVNRQKGISLSGLLVWSLILVMVSILGMKVIPVYIEYASIKKVLVTISSDSSLQTAGLSEIRQSFDKRARIDDIDVVKGSDLQISKENGQTILEISYSVKTPLFANISLFFDFKATSN
ncbi:MAG: DUF4845 domain-containing protein [Nitrosomonas sp.]|nr:DUF4845 domain-containing protein [Nitrosomonas sp.]MDP1951432.1 DUF4845 domain-containing protein [Nitrosomonas sp.]